MGVGESSLGSGDSGSGGGGGGSLVMIAGGDSTLSSSVTSMGEHLARCIAGSIRGNSSLKLPLSW